MIVSTICVCGAGTMGSGIAQLAATMGFNTILFELNRQVLERSKESIAKNLQTLVEKARMTPEEKENVLTRLRYSDNPNDCVAEIVIEAIIEDVEAKISLFSQLSKLNDGHTILATNTSSLSVTRIADHISNPERVIGLHFFNPAPLMKLVEVVKTGSTSDGVVQTTATLATQLGKVPVICQDSPGFIVNRVARPYYIESLRLVEEGKARVDTIDRLLEARGFKMGPFRLMDLIGNDINYAVSKSIYEQLNNPERLRPSVIQQRKVKAGELGKKTGKGYYEYNP